MQISTIPVNFSATFYLEITKTSRKRKRDPILETENASRYLLQRYSAVFDRVSPTNKRKSAEKQRKLTVLKQKKPDLDRFETVFW